MIQNKRRNLQNDPETKEIMREAACIRARHFSPSASFRTPRTTGVSFL